MTSQSFPPSIPLSETDVVQATVPPALREEIKESFLKRRLAKGFTQVLNAIVLHKNLKIYLAGPLDPVFQRKLDDTLGHIQNPLNEVIVLDKTYKRLVYDCIKDIANPNKKTATKPKRYFNTRVFAIIQ